MKREALIFERPVTLAATRPSEARGIPRDGIRLMVSDQQGHHHAHFRDLPDFLGHGDLLVVNDSQTIPASLPASGELGAFRLNLSTHYGRGLWLAEPRWSASTPGPLPLSAGERIEVARVRGRLVAPYPGLPRLWFVQFECSLAQALAEAGQPIRYGYVDEAYPLACYQTIFASQPGSAEMPSAAYPFTQRVVDRLTQRGVEIARITLHTGVSSLEVEAETVERHPLYPEPFAISEQAASTINAVRASGGRIIAVGTTVVRALESAYNGQRVRAMSGFTRRYVHPAHGIHVVDGLITGFHDPLTSHLAMLYAIGGERRIKEAYAEAIREKYLWHEFGDSHLIAASRLDREGRMIA